MVWISKQNFRPCIDTAHAANCAGGPRASSHNLSSYKGHKTRKMIEDAGAQLLFLPPTVRISIPSNAPSQSSRQGYEMPLKERTRRPVAPCVASGRDAYTHWAVDS